MNLTSNNVHILYKHFYQLRKKAFQIRFILVNCSAICRSITDTNIIDDGLEIFSSQAKAEILKASWKGMFFLQGLRLIHCVTFAPGKKKKNCTYSTWHIAASSDKTSKNLLFFRTKNTPGQFLVSLYFCGNKMLHMADI